MADNFYDFDQFVQDHEAQLKSIGFPHQLNVQLFNNLKEKKYEDYENTFKISKVKNSASGSMLLAAKDLPSHSKAFIANHIFSSTDPKKYLKSLQDSSELCEDLANVLNVAPKLDVEEVKNCLVQRKILNTLSKSKNIDKALLEYEGDTLEALMHLEHEEEEAPAPSPGSRDVKESHHDECTFEEFKEAMKSTGNMPENSTDEYLRKMYKTFLNRDIGSGTTTRYNWKEETGDAIVVVNVSIPKACHKKDIVSKLSRTSWHLTLGGKEILKGELYAPIKVDDSYWSIESPGLFCMTLEKVSSSEVWPELLKGEEQLAATEILQKFWLEKKVDEVYHNAILDNMWRHNQTYLIPTGGKQQPTWYVMDKYGSALTHAASANFQCAPFCYIPDRKFVSLYWPIADVKQGVRCTRNFLPQIRQLPYSAEIQQARMKAFLNKRFSNEKPVFDAGKVEKEETPDPSENVKVLSLEDSTFVKPTSGYKSIFVSGIDISKNELLAEKYALTFTTDKKADVKVFTVNDVTMKLVGDDVDASTMFANREYINNYLNYRMPDSTWLVRSLILPREILKFNTEFEKSILPQFWTVKTVDRSNLDVGGVVVSSKYARIVRMAEASPVAVTKFFESQPLFRNRRFTLSYSLVLSRKAVYIYTTPYIRQAELISRENDRINEHNNQTLITLAEVFQDNKIFVDFKVAMNRRLLPIDAKKGWSYQEAMLHRKLGHLGNVLANDLNIGDNFLVFSVDLLINENFDFQCIDINATSNLPSKEALEDLLKLTLGFECSRFVKIIPDTKL